MRRLLFATLLAIVVSSNVGCFLPIYSAEPTRRTRQLIDTSENQHSCWTNGNALVPRPAGSHESVPDSRRNHLMGLLGRLAMTGRAPSNHPPTWVR
ncbi:MAG: hypothetical protein R3B96_14010 [Pirellulaceae bacterium]